MTRARYITVACKSRTRWFDLDSERTPHQTNDAATRARPGTKRDGETRGNWASMGDAGSNPAGAPPLDCWLIDDDDPPPTTEEPPMSEARFIVSDVYEAMAKMPDDSVDCLITSPPFLALRSYLPADHPDKGKEIGSEPTPAAFLSTLLALTREWRRILTPTGSLCVELGDTYSGQGGENHLWDTYTGNGQGGRRYPQNEKHPVGVGRRNTARGWPLPKSLCLIPSLFAGSLAYGRNLLQPDDLLEPWRVRNLIVWHRPNPPVGALGDKVRPSTSYVTVACTAKDRWFDLDSERTDVKPHSAKYGDAETRARHKADGYQVDTRGDGGRMTYGLNPAGAPPLDAWFEDAPDADVWTIPTAPYAGSHYATFPPALPRRLINLMCPRQVCTVCGEPRRRFGNSGFGLQTELAAHIKERRTTLGLHPDDINGWFGYKEIARNWERTDPYGAAVPNAKDWPTLKERLDLDDRFDSFVMSRDPDHIAYITDDGQTLAAGERRTEFDRGGGGPTPNGNRIKADRIAPDEWSDCGHNTWRRGIVLDPFAGSGTTLQAASELGRDSIGIDLDRRNLELARQRLGMFLVESEDEVPA